MMNHRLIFTGLMRIKVCTELIVKSFELLVYIYLLFYLEQLFEVSIRILEKFIKYIVLTESLSFSREIRTFGILTFSAFLNILKYYLEKFQAKFSR